MFFENISSAQISRFQIRCLSLALIISTLPCTHLAALGRPSPLASGTSMIRGSNATVQDQSTLPIARIDALLKRRQGAEARRLIDSVKPTSSNKELIHLWRGLSYRADREPELAVAEFDQCKRVANFVDRSDQVAGSYSQVERYDKAIEILNVGIARRPTASLYGQRASYLCAQSKFAEAIPEYKKAAMQKDENQRTYLTAGADLLRRQGKSKEALALLDNGLTAKERLTDGKYWFCRANCFAELEDWAKAAQNCTEGVRIAQMAIAKSKWSEEIVLSHLLLARANCLDHLGKKDLAERDRKAHLKLGTSAEDIIMGKQK